jgi:hypothetical protein
MLWLTGLLCIAGIGAASFVSFPADQDTSDAEDEPDGGDFSTPAHDVDLLDQIESISAAETNESGYTAQPNRLDVLNSIKSAAAMHPESPGAFSQINTVCAEAEHETLDEPAHLFSVTGRNAVDLDDLWAFQADAGVEIDDPFPPQTTEANPGKEALGDWIMRGAPAEVLDYQHTSESLMLVWDDLEADAKEPEVSVGSDPFDEEVKHVLMNGKSVAEVYGDPNLTVADLTVIPLSSALIVGLEPEPEPV